MSDLRDKYDEHRSGWCACGGDFIDRQCRAFLIGLEYGKQEGIAEGRKLERGEVVAWLRFLDTDSSAQRILLDIVSDALERGDRINANDSTRDYQPRESHLDALRRCLRTHGEGIAEGRKLERGDVLTYLYDFIRSPHATVAEKNVASNIRADIRDGEHVAGGGK